MLRLLDRTLGRPIRHLLFVLTRTYYALFYNVSCSNKHLLQDLPGALILATHVSRHDGPLMLFPAGRIRRQPEEIIPEYLTGTHEILNTVPDVPVIILRIDGLGKFQDAKYDGFWSFVGRKNGRRHVSLEIEPYDKLDPSMPLADFNKHLEDVLNGPKV